MSIRDTFLLAALLLACGDGHAQQLIAPTEALAPDQEQRKFRLPKGFRAELVAAEPTINKPMNLAFDGKGRLWVTTSLEYPFPAKGEGRDRIVILEDFGPDGRARKATTFADGLNIPIGLLPLPDCKSALVFSIPHLWKLSDTDGDGKADHREILYTGFGYRDTHGMVNALTLSPDGWVYACHGFANDSVVKGKDGHEIRINSGHTIRFRPDGSRIEVWTRGQVNPFGMCFDPFGNLYTADCHSKPITQLLRGAYYDSFGKPHDGLGYGPHVTIHNHGSTGLCGLIWYAADYFPAEWYGRMLIGNCVTSRINADNLEMHGSSPKAVELPDFMTSDDPWFRPVDLELGPDGAIYVADFYNRIIGHYEVPLNHPGRDRERGRIWRIVTEQAPQTIVDLTSLTTVSLIERTLTTKNLSECLRCIHELSRRADAIPLLHQALKAQKASTLGSGWALMLLDHRLGEEIDSILLTTLRQSQSPLIPFVARILAERKQVSAELTIAVRDAVLQAEGLNLRSLVETVGLLGRVEFLPTLLAVHEKIPPLDGHLRHSYRIALRNISATEEGRSQLESKSFAPAEQVRLADVILGIDHPSAASFLVEYLRWRTPNDPRYQEYIVHAAKRLAPARMEELRLILENRRKSGMGLDRIGMIADLRSLQRGLALRGLRFEPTARTALLSLAKEILAAKSPELMEGTLELIAGQRLTEVLDEVAALLVERKAPIPLRSAAASALQALDMEKATAIIGPIAASPDEPREFRTKLVQVLAGMSSESSRRALVNVLMLADAHLAATIAQHLASSKPGARTLIDLIAAGKASARLLLDKAVADRVKSNAADQSSRVAELTKGLPSPDAALADLIRERRTFFQGHRADRAAGAKIFSVNCALCHQIGGQGAKIGPQLDGIGVRGVDRLLEDLLDPSRNVDHAFRATTITLDDGRVFSGLVVREEGDAVILIDAQAKEQRIAKAKIEERTLSSLSPMPADFSRQLSPADLGNLLAFLLEQRSK